MGAGTRWRSTVAQSREGLCRRGLALGEVTLGGLLIIGFALHKRPGGITTWHPCQGVERRRFAQLSGPDSTRPIGGVPTILGARLAPSCIAGVVVMFLSHKAR